MCIYFFNFSRTKTSYYCKNKNTIETNKCSSFLRKNFKFGLSFESVRKRKIAHFALFRSSTFSSISRLNFYRIIIFTVCLGKKTTTIIQLKI